MTNDQAKKAAEAIWNNVSDRRGFGLSELKYEDKDIYNDIIDAWVKVILAACKGGK